MARFWVKAVIHRSQLGRKYFKNKFKPTLNYTESRKYFKVIQKEKKGNIMSH